MSAAMLDQFVPVLHRFRQDHPAVEVSLQQMSSPDQLKALMNGDLDLGFVDVPPKEGALSVSSGYLEATVAWREALVAALPVTHRLANRKRVSLGELADEDFILPPREPAAGFYDQVIALCQKTSFSPRVVQQTGVLPVTMTFVAAGYGVSVVPACVCQPWLGLARFVALEGNPSIGVTMAWRPDENASAVSHFRRAVEEASPALITTAFDRAAGINI